MYGNYVEDDLISRIDAEREGVDLEEVETQSLYNQKARGFLLDWIGGAFDAANRFADLSNKLLAIREAALTALQAAKKGEIERLVARTGLSRRAIRALDPGDECKRALAVLEYRVKQLGEKRDEINRCLNARLFLDERRDYVKGYFMLKYSRQGHVQEAMASLPTLYPARERAVSTVC